MCASLCNNKDHGMLMIFIEYCHITTNDQLWGKRESRRRFCASVLYWCNNKDVEC